MFRHHLKQSRGIKALHKSLFSYKVRLPCGSIGVFFMPNFEKFNAILPMRQLLLKGFWSNPESPACNVSFRCSFFRMSRNAIEIRSLLTDMGSTGRKYVLNLE